MAGLRFVGAAMRTDAERRLNLAILRAAQVPAAPIAVGSALPENGKRRLRTIPCLNPPATAVAAATFTGAILLGPRRRPGGQHDANLAVEKSFRSAWIFSISNRQVSTSPLR